MPIENIESVELYKIDAVTGDIQEFTVTPEQNTAIRMYHYNGTDLPTSARIVNDKLQFGRQYIDNENVIESVNSIRLKSITFNGQYYDRFIPVLGV